MRFTFSILLHFYFFKKSLTALCNVFIAGLEFTAVPRVGNGMRIIGIISKEGNFSFGIPSENAFHVLPIPLVHPDEIIVFFVVFFLQLAGSFFTAINSQPFQNFPYRRIDRITLPAIDFFRGSRFGDYEKIFGSSVFLQYFFKINSAMGLRQMLPWQTKQIFSIDLIYSFLLLNPLFLYRFSGILYFALR